MFQRSWVYKVMCNKTKKCKLSQLFTSVKICRITKHDSLLKRFVIQLDVIRAFIDSERILPTILTSAPGSTSNPNKQLICNPKLCGDYVTRAEFYLSRGLNFQGHFLGV